MLDRNPAFADLLVALSTGLALEALPDDEERALRAERLSGRFSRVVRTWWATARP